MQFVLLGGNYRAIGVPEFGKPCVHATNNSIRLTLKAWWLPEFYSKSYLVETLRVRCRLWTDTNKRYRYFWRGVSTLLKFPIAGHLGLCVLIDTWVSQLRQTGTWWWRTIKPRFVTGSILPRFVYTVSAAERNQPPWCGWGAGDGNLPSGKLHCLYARL